MLSSEIAGFRDEISETAKVITPDIRSKFRESVRLSFRSGH